MCNVCSSWGIKYLNLSTVQEDTIGEKVNSEQPKIIISSIEKINSSTVQKQLFNVKFVYISLDEAQVIHPLLFIGLTIFDWLISGSWSGNWLDTDPTLLSRHMGIFEGTFQVSISFDVCNHGREELCQDYRYAMKLLKCFFKLNCVLSQSWYSKREDICTLHEPWPSKHLPAKKVSQAAGWCNVRQLS